jgi:hypothetical protein
MRALQRLAVLLAALLPLFSYGQEGVGYPSVAAALEALKARNDVLISVQGGWTIVDDPRDGSLWSFTPPSHPAHPAVVKRNPAQKDGAMFIQMRALCQAEKAACAKLIEEFQELNRKIAADMQRRSQAPKSQWSASDEQKNRAVATLQRFLAATDEGRHKDAYDMLTPGMKGMMSFDRFVALEQKFREQSGGEASRTDARATWYKDPPQAAAPGVYAAFSIRCSFKKISMCEEVVILHEQDNGEFLVMRQERNFVDKENERKLRDAQDKKQGS